MTATDRVSELQATARRVRGSIIDMSYRAKTAHLGSSLSCVDVMVALYWSALNIDVSRPDAEDRDRFILSKGHAATSLYAVLAERGFFPHAWLETYAEPGDRLSEHPIRGSAPGIEITTGSLGHGLPTGLGLALAARIRRQAYRVAVVMSDGECNEGSVWEGALLAAAQRVDNLLVVIDYNKWQATGRSEDVMAIKPLAAKWASFGWSVHEVDGHDLGALVDLFSRFPDGSGKPMAVVAHTVKGKGVSFMEDENDWHYRIPTESDVTKARHELGLA
jgi:transketolase